MAKRDVDLIIRAKNAASRELDQVTKSLQKLDDQQTAVGDSAKKTDSLVGQLADEFAKLQTVSGNIKSLDKIREQIEKASAAISRQKADLATARTNYQQLSTAQQVAATSSERLQRQLGESAAALKTEAAAVAVARAQFKQYEQDSRRAAAAAAAAQKALAAAQKRYAEKPNLRNEAALIESAQAVQRTQAAQREAALAAAQFNRVLASQNQALSENQRNQASLSTSLKNVQSAEAGLAKEIARTSASIDAQGGDIAQAEKHYQDLVQTVEQAEAVFQQAARANGVVGQSAAQVGQQLTILRAKMQELQATQRAAGAGVKPLINAQEIRDGDLALREASTTIRAATNAATRGAVGLRELGNAVEETARAGQRLDNLLRSVEKQDAAVAGAKQAWREAQNEVQRLAIALRNAERPSEELAAAFGRAQGEAKAAKIAFQGEEAAAESLSAALRLAGVAHKDLNQATEVLRTRISANRDMLLRGRAALIGYGEAGGGAARGSRNAAAGIGAIPPAANNASASLKEMIRQLQGADAAGRQSLSLFQRFRGQLLSLAAASGGVYAVQTAMQSVVKASLELDAVQSRFSVAFEGDQTKVAKAMAFTRKTADELGLVYTTLATQYSKLSAAALGTNLEGEKTEQIFRAMSEAARVLRLTDEEVAGSFKALTDIISKGTIQAEELKGQLGDRFPGAVQIMAQALGVGTDELAKMMEQGELTSDALFDFANQIQKRVAPALQDAIESPAASFAKLQNSIFDAQVAIAKSGFIDELAKGAEDLAVALSDPAIQQSLRAVGQGLGDLIRYGAQLIPYIDQIGTALQVLATFMLVRFVGSALFDTYKGLVRVRKGLGLLIEAAPVLRNALLGITTASAAAGGGVAGLAAAIGLVAKRAALIGVVVTALYKIAEAANAAYDAYQASQALEAERAKSATRAASAQDTLRKKTQEFAKAQAEAQGALVKTQDQAGLSAKRVAELADASAAAFRSAEQDQSKWVKSSAEVVKMTDKEIDAYQDYLIALMRVVGERRTAALMNPNDPDSARIIAETTAQENMLADAVKESATQESIRRAAMAKTVETTKALAESMADATLKADQLDRRLSAVATMNFDNSVIALERVHTAAMAALTISGADSSKMIAQNTAFEEKRLALVRQYTARQLEIVKQDTEERKRILGMQELDAAKRQEELVKIEKQASDRRIQIAQSEVQAVSSAREGALSRYMAALERVADLDRRIADLRMQGEFQVADIRRSAMTDQAAYMSRSAELAKLNGRIQEEIARGNYEVAESLAQRQMALAQQLNTEVKDGERVLVSKEQAATNAVKGTEMANKNLITVLEKRREIEKAEAEQQKKLYENLTSTLERLNKTLAQMSGATEIDIPLTVDEAKAKESVQKAMDGMRAVVFQDKVGVPVTADTREYVQKFDSDVLADDGTKVRVGVFLEDGAYKIKVNEIKNEKITATAAVEFSGSDLQRAIARAKEIVEGDFPKMQLAFDSSQTYDEFMRFSFDMQAKLSKESFLVTAQLQGDDVELNAKIQQITDTVTPAPVEFVPNTAAADQARNNIAQPIIVPVQYVPSNSVPARANGGAIRVPGFANGGSPGGLLSGPGTGTSDSILAAVSNNEYIVRAMAVKKYGQGFMNALNSGSISPDRLQGVMSGGPQFEATLNLNLNGQAMGALSGSRDTVNNFVEALTELQRQLGNSG